MRWTLALSFSFWFCVLAWGYFWVLSSGYLSVLVWLAGRKMCDMVFSTAYKLVGSVGILDSVQYWREEKLEEEIIGGWHKATHVLIPVTHGDVFDRWGSWVD
jgi:hypothetical protein